tara:strand:- start:5354 stop:5635 length:282 start_codon:yes stop_codon:yes gene_type:complete
MKPKMDNIKDIQEIELHYTSWMIFEIENLSDENLELWTSGKVKRFWVKYMTLFMELEDETIVEQEIYTETHEDIKWPIKTFVKNGDKWSEWNE